MKKLILILTFFITSINCHSQVYLNCVKNGGFEELFDCYAGLNQVHKAKGWSTIDSIRILMSSGDSIGAMCASEVCHSCISSTWDFSTPSSSWYYQYPRTGLGMSHVYMYNNNGIDTTSEYYLRDYLQGHLQDTLVSGKEYCIAFYTVLTERSAHAINGIGAYLDDGSIDTTSWCTSPQTSYVPQAMASSIINDTLHWQMIRNTFVSNGTERFITIGNFLSTAFTSKLRVYLPLSIDSIFTMYLIDDVSVLPLDAVAYAGVDDTTWPGGDSVWIGTRDSYLPCRWYSNGALIDSGRGGFKVFPDTTTFYVMELDVCGTLTYDTVMVYVGDSSMGIALQAERQSGYTLYPNPAQDLLHISRKAGTAASIPMQLYDGMGRVVQSGMLSFKGDEATLNIALLPQGIYLLRLNGVSLRFMKE